jgi:hypothetical protein
MDKSGFLYGLWRFIMWLKQMKAIFNMIHSIKTAVAQPRTILQRINAANQASTI